MKHPADINNLDFELYFSTEVLELRSLHYGYFEDKKGPSLAHALDNILTEIKKAQDRYTETLVELIPNGVEKILDVGSGIGDLSKTLAGRGYAVTALSPDKNHKKFYQGEEKIDFLNMSFEDLKTSEKFDCVIMSESSGYFDYKMALSKCRSLLHDGGYFINSGLFRKRNAKGFANISDVYEDYIALAEEIGLRKLKEIDITEETVPTLGIIFECYEKYFLPTVEMAGLYMHESSPIKTKILSLLLRKQLKKLHELQAFYEERLDPEKFKQNALYLRLVFQKQ